MKKYDEIKLKEITTDKYEIELNMPKDYPPIKARKTEEGGVRDRFMAAKAELPDEITVVKAFDTNGFQKSNANTVYVAVDGDDSACGCKAAPLATLGEAINRMAGKKGGKVVLADGYYDIEKPVEITAEHSGTKESPLIITCENRGQAYLSASKKIDAAAFAPVTDEAVLARLKKEVHGKVMVADLKALGIEDYGMVAKNGAALIVNGAILSLARYPNEGEPLLKHTKDIYKNAKTDGESEWEMGLADTRYRSWQERDDIYMYGGVEIEFLWESYPVKGFNRERDSVISVPVRGGHDAGIHYNPWCMFFFENVFEELDVPGEWYVDRENGLLYLYPPKGELCEADDIRFLVGKSEIILCKNAENVIIDGLDIGRCGGCAIRVKDCKQVLIQRCHITGTRIWDIHDSFESAVELLGGYRNGIIASKLEYFSTYGCKLVAGDKATLTPANNFIQNCVFTNAKNRMAIFSGGCGNVISHNYLHYTTMNDCGHNEGIIEYNIIEGGDVEGHDSGMMYIAGGGCTFCANHYRYNYLFDFARCDYGIYFDDMSRGMYAYGNIVVGNGVNPGREDKDGQWWYSGGRTFNHHNGGEHVYYNNISIDAGFFAFGGDITYYLHSFGEWKPWCEHMYGASLARRSDKYLDRNPTYRDYCAALDKWHEDIQNPDYVPGSGWAEMRLRTPWCNHYENNVILRADRPYKLDTGEATATGLDTNFITNDDPGFVNEAQKDYRIKADAEIFKHIPDFVPPCFERMGLVEE